MPNTLADLNRFSNRNINYVDARGYAITVSGTPTTQSVNVGEDQTHFLPKSFSFTQIQSVPGNVTMWINTNTANSAASVFYTSWETTSFPQGITFSEPEPGIYKLQGLNGVSAFNTYSTPAIVAKDRTTAYSYTANVVFPDPLNPVTNQQLSWNVNVSIANTHSELSGVTQNTWNEDSVIYVTGAPQVTDMFTETGDFNLTITPNNISSVFQISSTGSAVSTFDAVNKVLTLTGTKVQVNSNLANIVVYPPSDSTANFLLTYELTNPVSNLITSQTQAFVCGNTHAEYSLTNTYTYNEDTPVTLIWDITDTAATADNYTVTISQNNPDPGITPGRFSVDGAWLPSGVAYTENGSKAFLNARTVQFDPPPDYTSNVILSYNQIKYDSILGNITQASNVGMNVNIASTHGDYTLTTSYNYYENYDTAIVYSITDTDPTPGTYTLTFNQTAGTAGVFKVDGVEYPTPCIVSGTKAALNALTVTWRSTFVGDNPTTITYTQVKHDPIGNIIQANAVPTTWAWINFGTDGTRAPLTTLVWEEDTIKVLTQFALNDAPDGRTLEWIGDAGHGDWLYANGVSIGKTMTVTGNAATVDSTISARSWLPGADETANANITVSLTDTTHNAQYYGGELWPNYANVTHNEYTVLANPTRNELRSQVPLASYQITDTRPNGQYSVTIRNGSTLGNLWIDGTAVTGNSVTITGNKTTVNASLSNASSYWQQVRDTSVDESGAIWTQGSNIANTVLYFSASRTSPNAVVFTSNTASQINVNYTPNEYEPQGSVGSYTTGYQFQGGYLTGSSESSPPISNTILVYHPGEDATGYPLSISTYNSDGYRRARFTTSSDAGDIPSASNYNYGYNNTKNLKDTGNVGPSLCVLPGVYTTALTTNEFNDWYVPAANEMVSLDVAGSRVVLGTPPPGSTVRTYWTSTANANVYMYSSGNSSVYIGNTYSNLRTSDTTVASTLPVRRAYTHNQFFRAPLTGTGSASATIGYTFPNWNIGLLEDTETYSITLNVASGQGFIYQNFVTLSTVTLTGLTNASQLNSSLTANGNEYIGGDHPTTTDSIAWTVRVADIGGPGAGTYTATYTITRESDGFIIEPNGSLTVTFS